MLNLLMVFIGGGIGCVLRYLGNTFFARFVGANLFYSTLTVNFIGSLILGIAFIFFFQRQDLPPSLKYAITVGFCGGLTTFSTYSLEIFEMIKTGNFMMALTYSIFSVLICVIAISMGTYIAKTIF